MSEYGSKINVLAKMYFDVLSIPISTGSIGTFASLYSSFIFIAKHQKCDGVHTNTKNPTKNPRMSIEPVAADQPAIAAALPANPPITIFEEFNRFNHAV